MARPTIDNPGDWFVVLRVVQVGGRVVLEGRLIEGTFPIGNQREIDKLVVTLNWCPLLVIFLASPISLKLIFVMVGAVNWKIGYYGWRPHF